MGRRRLFSRALMLAVWTSAVLSDPGGPALQSYLSRDTFVITDLRFNSPVTSVIPVNNPVMQTGVAPQRSFVPSQPHQQQAVIPQRSFQPSVSSQQHSYLAPQRPFLPASTPQQQANFVPGNALAPIGSHQQATEFSSQRPSRQQANVTPQRSYVPANTPQQQSNVIAQRPVVPANTPHQQSYLIPQGSTIPAGTTQQHSEFGSQRPAVPSLVHSSVPANNLRPVPTTRQPTRVSQSTGTFQHPSSSQQTDHRFSSTVSPASQHSIPQNRQRPVNSGHRQIPKPHENTIRNPSNRHHLCGVSPPSGDCRAAFPRYYYNNQTDQCDCFLYGGCGHEGLKYSYQTLEECQITCSPSRMEEGPACKEIFFEDEVFIDTPIHNIPHTHPSREHGVPRPISTTSPIHTPVDTSHIPDKPLLILLVNSANKGHGYNTDFESNETRH